MKRFSFILLASLVFVSCNNKQDSKNDNVSRILESTIIEPQIILADTLPKPNVIPQGKISKVKPGKPKQITVKNNRLAHVDTIKIKAGNPIKISLTDSIFKPPSEHPAIAKKVKAGLPVIVEASEAYTIPENPFSFSFYTRSQGLPHDDIWVIANDRKGKLWLGTDGAGLISFNGSTFNYYTTESGLPDNLITSLLIDKDDNIWMATRNNGVTRFNGKYFETYTEEEGLYSNDVRYIFQDSNNDFWFCTFEGGVSHFDGRKFTNYDQEQGLPGNPVFAAVEDNDRNIWFTTLGGGVSRFDGNSFENYTTRQGLSSDFIRTAIKDTLGNIWFGTLNAGISIFDGNYFYNLNENTGLTDNNIISLYKDHSGKIWIGTRGQGILKFDYKYFYYFKESEGVFNTHITDITEDSHGRIWFGTFGGGIGQYNGDVFKHYNESEGLYDSFTRSIIKDSDGNLWLASNISGVFIYDGNRLLNYDIPHGLPNDRARTLLRDSNDNIWIGFADGNLVKYDGEYFYIYSEASNNNVFFSISTLWEDKDGNIWIGTLDNGVFKYDGKSFINYTTESGLPDNNISKIYGDEHGNIWISSFYDGLARFDGQNFAHYTVDQGLPSNELLDMIVDNRGIVWVTTNGYGVFSLLNDRIVNFVQEQGLGSNFVFSVFQDSNGGLWFGTRMGLSKMLYSDKISFERRQYMNGGYAHKYGIFFKNYNRTDGFLGIGCNSRAIFEDNDGMIWIGANDILTRFNPYIGVHDTIPPIIHLTSINLYNENIPWTDLIYRQDTTLLLGNGVKIRNFTFSDVSPWYGLPQNLKLAYNNNYVVFNYSGSNGRFQHMIRYQYKLEGLDDNWSNFTKRTEAHYGNLPPGKYVFKLRAMNSEAYMSKLLIYPFTINPPWWRTWWAYLLYSAISLLILSFLYKYRKIVVQQREKRRREEWLLQQEMEVARKAVEFKQNFLANMSHEIRTPLTGLMGMAEILNKTPLNDQQKDYLQTLMQSGENLREIINMVLDYSKIEAGQYKINKGPFSMQELLNDAEKYFFSICKKDIIFKKFMEQKVPEYLETDRKKVYQIITNLLSNAVKYTNEGQVGFHISLDKQTPLSVLNPGENCLIKISVSDTGKGINKEEQKILFKPFYQIDQDFERNVEGTGLGLSICKELTELLGGKIGLVSQKNQGTTFWFTFMAKIIEAPAETLDGEKDTYTSTNSLNILFVEDKVVNQKVIQLMLESLGHKVSIAANGQEAIDKYTPDTFDIILMDIQMPVMDGITATKKLREMYHDLPPIVGLSANAFEGDREKYMSLGMDEYITKPVNENDFIEIINKLKL